jgi:hypothetical protein
MTRFSEKVIEYKMCVLISSINLSEEFLILRIIQRNIDINIHRSSCRVLFILVRFSKNNPIINCTEIPPLGSELLHSKQYTNRRADEGADRHDEA